jgi:hypothetical protein
MRNSTSAFQADSNGLDHLTFYGSSAPTPFRPVQEFWKETIQMGKRSMH